MRETLLDWIHTTVNKFAFDGVRFDLCSGMKKEFLGELGEAAGVFHICEKTASKRILSGLQNYQTGLINFPMLDKI